MVVLVCLCVCVCVCCMCVCVVCMCVCVFNVYVYVCVKESFRLWQIVEAGVGRVHQPPESRLYIASRALSHSVATILYFPAHRHASGGSRRVLHTLQDSRACVSSVSS